MNAERLILMLLAGGLVSYLVLEHPVAGTPVLAGLTAALLLLAALDHDRQ